MNQKIALLRGINVGGKRKIRMADLRQLCTTLGYSNVQTYIQSGNIIFHTTENNNTDLQSQLSSAIDKQYGFQVPTIVLDAETFTDILSNNPFITDNDINSLHVTFLDQAIPEEQTTALHLQNYPDQIACSTNLVYLKCTKKYHQTKYSNQYFEKQLNCQATTRNWKTIQAIAQKINKP